MARLRDLSPSEANFSLLCQDLSQVSQYVAPLPQPVFKLMKRALPGPFTFILNAGVKVPRIFRKSKKEVGIRIPDHAVPKALIEAIGRARRELGPPRRRGHRVHDRPRAWSTRNTAAKWTRWLAADSDTSRPPRSSTAPRASPEVVGRPRGARRGPVTFVIEGGFPAGPM